MIENAAVQAERERQHGSMDDGVLDGDAWVGYPLLEVFNKEVKMLTPYEQGFVLMVLYKRWTKGDK
jgi:hypothetical protein